jgi:hypothetical protein
MYTIVSLAVLLVFWGLFVSFRIWCRRKEENDPLKSDKYHG